MGSIQKRTYTAGKPPRWIARTRHGGRERTKSFSTQREAKHWLKEQEGLAPSAMRLDRMTVHDVMELRCKDPDASKATIRIREHALANLGGFGSRRVDQVSSPHVDEWRTQLIEGRPWMDGKPLAPVTAENVLAQVSAMFRWLVDEGQIPRNPARRKSVSRQSGRQVVLEKDLMPEDLVKDLMGRDTVLRPLVMVGATTGLRAGEVGGLRVRSVGGGVVRVREQAGVRASKHSWRDVKTRSGVRDVPVPREVEAECLWWADGRDLFEPLFLTVRGGQWCSSRIGQVWNKVFPDAAELGFTFHSLRHFYATKLIESGSSVSTVQRLLGHATPAITLQTYTHFWPGEDDKTRTVFDDLLGD